MGNIRRRTVKNYIEVPEDCVIEMAGDGLETITGSGPPKLGIRCGDGLKVEGGLVHLDLRKHNNKKYIRVISNVHINMDDLDLVLEKEFTVYEIQRTWFGLVIDLVEVEKYTMEERVTCGGGGYMAMLQTSARTGTKEEPNFYA